MRIWRFSSINVRSNLAHDEVKNCCLAQRFGRVYEILGNVPFLGLSSLSHRQTVRSVALSECLRLFGASPSFHQLYVAIGIGTCYGMVDGNGPPERKPFVSQMFTKNKIISQLLWENHENHAVNKDIIKLSPNMVETSVREGRVLNPAIRNMNVKENRLLIGAPSLSLLRILSCIFGLEVTLDIPVNYEIRKKRCRPRVEKRN
uniref:Uncharacterized protein n=1 Tax=Solanum lycopersicum TaxID=4081 RepID=A0A3Q7F6V1_SOLLC